MSVPSLLFHKRRLSPCRKKLNGADDNESCQTGVGRTRSTAGAGQDQGSSRAGARQELGRSRTEQGGAEQGRNRLGVGHELGRSWEGVGKEYGGSRAEAGAEKEQCFFCPLAVQIQYTRWKDR